jgi:hypothetical protein
MPLHAPTVTPFTPKSFIAPPVVEPPDVTPTRAPAPADRRPAAEQRVTERGATERAVTEHAPTSERIVADAFTALLAVEQGEPGARPVRLTSASAEPVITDALIDEIARRVMERLSPAVVRDAVTDLVSEVTERLVREEIERIRKRQ